LLEVDDSGFWDLVSPIELGPALPELFTDVMVRTHARGNTHTRTRVHTHTHTHTHKLTHTHTHTHTSYVHSRIVAAIHLARRTRSELHFLGCRTCRESPIYHTPHALDWSIVLLNCTTLPPLHTAERLQVVGFPRGGRQVCMTKGVVSRVTSKGFAIDHFPSPSQLAIQIDAAINPGNSGGPALCVLLLSPFLPRVAPLVTWMQIH
jgi:hypothetical protein